MSSSQAQISAIVSESTREKLDRFTQMHGLKKNYVIEQALLLFMESRRELPDEAFIPARLVLSEGSFDTVVEMLDRPPAPTAALEELMRGPKR